MPCDLIHRYNNIWDKRVPTDYTGVCPQSRSKTLKNDVTHSTDILVTVYQTTRCHITDHITSHKHQRYGYLYRPNNY